MYRAAAQSHNRLAEVVSQLAGRHEKIWYFYEGRLQHARAPGAASELDALQKSHRAIHLYIVDVHGMSWTGRNGAGTVLGFRKMPERTVVALGSSKALPPRAPHSCLLTMKLGAWCAAVEAC